MAHWVDRLLTSTGIGAMEMVAMEMKSLGMYCSRHLSFSGTEFDIVQLPLAAKQRTLYDMCTACAFLSSLKSRIAINSARARALSPSLCHTLLKALSLSL